MYQQYPATIFCFKNIANNDIVGIVDFYRYTIDKYVVYKGEGYKGVKMSKNIQDPKSLMNTQERKLFGIITAYALD